MGDIFWQRKYIAREHFLTQTELLPNRQSTWEENIFLVQTLDEPLGEMDSACAASATDLLHDLGHVTWSCCPSLAVHKMKIIIWLFSCTLPSLFYFSCQLLQEEAVHLVLLLSGSECTVSPHLSMLPNNKCLSFQQGWSNRFCRLPEKGRVFCGLCLSRWVRETKQMPSFQVLGKKLSQYELQPTRTTTNYFWQKLKWW